MKEMRLKRLSEGKSTFVMCLPRLVVSQAPWDKRAFPLMVNYG